MGKREWRGKEFCQRSERNDQKKNRKEKGSQSVDDLTFVSKGMGRKRAKRNFAGGEEGKKIKRNTYWPFLFGWRSKGSEDGFELIHVTFSGEVWYSKHQLRKYASDGPNINGSTVVATTEQ
jgi:hypothetical protein